jgi:ligand-binding sensor domain-containing protein/DNA-binding response OmpR family regulator/nitrogen-specific signal transduction histidine kinase
MKKIPTYILLFALFTPLSMQGEANYTFRRFGVEHGLPQNTVSCIFQDKQGFMWFGTKDGLSRYDGYTFRNFRHDRADTNSIGNNFIRSIFQGENEALWIGTDRGVYIYSPATEKFTRFDLQTANGITIEKEVNDIKSDKEGNIWLAVDWQGVFRYIPRREELIFYELNTIVNAWSICIDRENNVWTGTHGGGLNCYNRRSDRFEAVPVSGEAGDDIYRLFQDNYNNLLIGTASSGVKKLNLVNRQIQPLLEPEINNHLFVRDIIRKSDNELWIGTESGVYIYHTQNRTVKNLSHDHFDPYSLSDNAVYSLYKDREGGVWIGTYFGGVNYYSPQYTPFERFYLQNRENTIRGKRIREFQQDRYGDLWIGTEDGGLTCYNPRTGAFRNFMPDGSSQSICYHNIHGLLADGDRLWIGTFAHGLNVIDLKTQKVIRHYKKTEDPNSLCDNSVFAIYRDDAGNLWLGTIYGLALYNPQKDNFTKIEYTGDTFIYDIFQSYDGILWFASFNQGLFRYNPRNGEWKIFKHQPENKKSLPHDKVISICEDSQKNLWITSEGGGFCRYNPENETFTSFSTKDGLPNDVVYKMLEDDKGRFWFTTNKGLSCFNPANGAIKTCTLADGLPDNQFNYKSGIRTADGKLYFGCLNGFIAFDPLTFSENNYIPPIVITGFRLFNKKKEARDDLPPHQSERFNTQGEIHLKHNRSSFTIDFAALSYTAPEKNKYACLLEGYEKEWTELTGINSVTYSNIPPGKYVFHLKGSNSDGKWNNIPLTRTIHIHPPFYKTRWAYTIYALLLCCFTFLFILSCNKRQKRRNKRRLELFENEKNKELYNAKITFFTNIAHEIRTPLSLIKGPVEHILTQGMDREEMTENLKVIEKNTNRLLDLSNQLLDFRKMEAKGFQPNYMRSDVKQLINDVYTRFRLTARQKNLSFEMQLPPDSLWADVDREAVTKIISNLFTNAIKYARSKIVLTLENTEDNQFSLKVSNDGHLIPEEMKEKIFEPFFRIGDESGNSIKSGAGLGLPLARSLAELHHGKLYLDILPGQLNIFVLQLPLTQDSVISVQEENTEQETETPQGEESPFRSRPTVLIVEDDREMRHFLYSKLKRVYNVVKASNGKTALECLQKENVDIVVTDVMMPEMDGLQLCSEIKSDVASSHIPVIMLTAKADIKSRIEGLDAGADAYVEKPFSVEHLLAQISNIFTNRNKVKQAFINSPVQNTGSIALTRADEIFLGKVTRIIDKNLSDVNFNVDLLADELHMSRSSLHRKIKGISELTPNDFIQVVRLKKAAELLQEGSYRINEICFLVGFASSSYFSKRFKKQFGVPPKEIKPNEHKNCQ